jgi:hypothetical protein
MTDNASKHDLQGEGAENAPSAPVSDPWADDVGSDAPSEGLSAENASTAPVGDILGGRPPAPEIFHRDVMDGPTDATGVRLGETEHEFSYQHDRPTEPEVVIVNGKRFYPVAFDVTKRMTLEQEARLGMAVLDRYADGAGPITAPDARRLSECLTRLLVTIRHDREECGKLAARIRVLDGERDEWVIESATGQQQLDDLLNRLEVASAALQDITTNRDNLRTYLAERTAERDEAVKQSIAASDAKRRIGRIMDAVILEARRGPPDVQAVERKTFEQRDRDEDALIALHETERMERALRFVAELATMTDTEADFVDGAELRETARLLAVGEAVTIPRVYGREDAMRAAAMLFEMNDIACGMPRCLTLVEMVAEALGMRRAEG